MFPKVTRLVSASGSRGRNLAPLDCRGRLIVIPTKEESHSDDGAPGGMTKNRFAARSAATDSVQRRRVYAETPIAGTAYTL